MSLEIFAFSFMHRALIAGTAIAILCSVIGLFLVLRRYSLFGDAIAHSSFGGIALGLLAGVYPLWTAYGVSLVSAVIITRVKEKFNIQGFKEAAAEGFVHGHWVTVVAENSNRVVEFKAKVRIDTPQEFEYYRNGGILQYVLRELHKQQD